MRRLELEGVRGLEHGGARCRSESSPRPFSAREAVDAETPPARLGDVDERRPPVRRVTSNGCASDCDAVIVARRVKGVGSASPASAGWGRCTRGTRSGCPGRELVAVASTRAEVAASELRGELGVRAARYEELFAADDVDAVVLAARSIDHAERWRSRCSQAGKHLFLEKPGATTVAGQDAVLARRRAGRSRSCRSATTAASTRGWQSRRRRRVEEGAIGRPLVVCRRRPRRANAGARGSACRPAGSWSTWPRTTTTPRAGSSGRSRSRCRRPAGARLPRARGARRPRQRAVTVRFDGGGIALAAHLAHLPVGPRRARRGRGDEGSLFVGEPGRRCGWRSSTASRCRSRFPADYRARSFAHVNVELRGPRATTTSWHPRRSRC